MIDWRARLAPARANVLLLASLPSQVFVVLLLELLNSYRSFGLRFVKYQLITNEYGLSDLEAGALLGVAGNVQMAFLILGSVVIDLFGVRRTALFSLSCAVVSRALIVFGRSRATLLTSLLVLSPLGEQLLSIGLYKVALKKLTPPRARPLVFAVQYATFNLAGALCDVYIDHARTQPDEVYFGQVFTGLRRFLFTTWLAILAALAIAVLYLHDQTVIDPDDPEEDGVASGGDEGGDGAKHLISATAPSDCGGGGWRRDNPFAAARAWRTAAVARFRVVPTPQRTSGVAAHFQELRARDGTAAALLWAARGAWADVRAVVRLRGLWMVITFSTCVLLVSMQWSAMDTVLPPFLERLYGEKTPIYTIHSINLWGCLALPPLVGAFTADHHAFEVFMPGLWIMAASPVFLVLSPSVASAALWLSFLTLGEVIWSPRQAAWVVTLAPAGREGVFLALSEIKGLLLEFPSYWFLGWLNSAFNPNCEACRDEFGHFCGTSLNATCASEEGACDAPAGGWVCRGDDCGDAVCPVTCHDCPGWEEDSSPRTLWLMMLLVSLVSPLLVWLFLPFLTGSTARCYGICSCGAARLLGVLGVVQRASESRTPSADAASTAGMLAGEAGKETELEMLEI